MQVRCHIKVLVHSELQFCLVGRGFHRLASGRDVQSELLAPEAVERFCELVCEFKSTWHWWFNQYRVMTPLERLQVRARRESLALSQVAVKVPGLWGVQALSEARPKSGIGSSSFSLEARERFLQDAIEAHRDDILRFYLDHIVNLDAAPVKHPTGHTRVEASEDIETVEWLGGLKYAAITLGTPDSIRQLLEHGADPNLPTMVFDVVGDVVDRKPLAEAWLAGFHQLFLHGADPNPVISAVVEKYARPRERRVLDEIRFLRNRVAMQRGRRRCDHAPYADYRERAFPKTRNTVWNKRSGTAVDIGNRWFL